MISSRVFVYLCLGDAHILENVSCFSIFQDLQPGFSGQTVFFCLCWHFDVKYKGLTPTEQCRMFYDADIIVVTHGAHMANTLCSREGSLVVEMAAGHFGWTSGHSARETYIEPMGLKYKALFMKPEWDLYSNFTMNYTVIRDLILEHRKQT